MPPDTEPHQTDRRLVEDFLGSRDERAFRELYRRHTPAIYRFALARLRAEDEAQDALQDTWIRAVEALEDFRWRSSLKTWLIGITLNRCRERYRHNRRRAGGDPAVILDARPAPPLRDSISYLQLESAIAELPPGYREVLILHDVENLTHEEIGRLLGINTGTSKSQLSRSRQAIRARLGAEKGSQHGRAS